MSESGRTLVCSVLFLDIAGYSRMGVEQQVELKEKFNGVLRGALDYVAAEERVVIDTGDGAAIAVLGNPERALLVALAIFDRIGDLRVRGGANLGPVSLMKDINGQANVIGDGINVAQRIMAFAEEGEFLVSRSFFDVVSLLSADYGTMFTPAGSRVDKNERAHEVFAVNHGVRVGRRMAEAQSRAPRPAAGEPAARAAQISDAGTHYIVSGYSKASVEETLARLAEEGHPAAGPITQIGSKWFASIDNPSHAVAATVEEFGFKRIVSGPTREAVASKVDELLQYGATLVQDIEQDGAVWTAVCEKT